MNGVSPNPSNRSINARRERQSALSFSISHVERTFSIPQIRDNPKHRVWSLSSQRLRCPIFPIPIIPFATSRGRIRSGGLGRFGGTTGWATFVENRGRLFLGRAVAPCATGRLRGILLLKVASGTSRGRNGEGRRRRRDGHRRTCGGRGRLAIF